eukprot:CAMPEP_0182483844 /NCGR_PEP_ID=MMETSP1319-20130603/42229_1 /TAXON_ID=172717 /ORGANISM="Bolidomonas pacifica, Strain RCC208" /LENGTH=100 /DNA_ID=CAMNT_0024685689 /DNA_START=43 /DNA_END=341 /DNA_ORIENTATION=-
MPKDAQKDAPKDAHMFITPPLPPHNTSSNYGYTLSSSPTILTLTTSRFARRFSLSSPLGALRSHCPNMHLHADGLVYVTTHDKGGRPQAWLLDKCRGVEG